MERKPRQPILLYGRLPESKRDPDAITPRECVEMFFGALLFTVGAAITFVVSGHHPFSVAPWLTAGVYLFRMGHSRRLK